MKPIWGRINEVPILLFIEIRASFHLGNRMLKCCTSSPSVGAPCLAYFWSFHSIATWNQGRAGEPEGSQLLGFTIVSLHSLSHPPLWIILLSDCSEVKLSAAGAIIIPLRVSNIRTAASESLFFYFQERNMLKGRGELNYLPSIMMSNWHL